jgi:hypothetical protein
VNFVNQKEKVGDSDEEVKTNAFSLGRSRIGVVKVWSDKVMTKMNLNANLMNSIPNTYLNLVELAFVDYKLVPGIATLRAGIIPSFWHANVYAHYGYRFTGKLLPDEKGHAFTYRDAGVAILGGFAGMVKYFVSATNGTQGNKAGGDKATAYTVGVAISPVGKLVTLLGNWYSEAISDKDKYSEIDANLMVTLDMGIRIGAGYYTYKHDTGGSVPNPNGIYGYLVVGLQKLAQLPLEFMFYYGSKDEDDDNTKKSDMKVGLTYLTYKGIKYNVEYRQSKTNYDKETTTKKDTTDTYMSLNIQFTF